MPLILCAAFSIDASIIWIVSVQVIAQYTEAVTSHIPRRLWINPLDARLADTVISQLMLGDQTRL